MTTLTETALDREMLLVALPDTESVTDGNGYDPNEAPRLQAEFDATGHLGEAATTSRWPSVVRFGLIVVALVSIGMVVQLAFVSGIEHRSAQVSLYNRFRTELALGTAPLGPGSRRHPVAMGAPIAQITIPSIGVNQVVVEGTTGTLLANGPGHYRSTVFPGGTGDSVILGRAARLRGPVRADQHAQEGGPYPGRHPGGDVGLQGDRRQAGRQPRCARCRPAPRVSPWARRRARPSSPPGWSGWTPRRTVRPSPPNRRWSRRCRSPNGRSASTPAPCGRWPCGCWSWPSWSDAAVWTWRRRGRAQAWIVFTAPVLLVWMFIADQFARLLPNLL